MTEDTDWLAAQRPNNPTLEHLYSTPAQELARLSVEELAMLQGLLTTEQARVKRMADNFHAAVTDKLQARFADAYAELNKDTGKVSIAEGDCIVCCDIRKDVKWDQDLLIELWGALLTEGKEPRDYIKTELTVPEAVFAKLSPVTRDRFMRARTTKPGKPVYKFVDQERRP